MARVNLQQQAFFQDQPQQGVGSLWDTDPMSMMAGFQRDPMTQGWPMDLTGGVQNPLMAPQQQPAAGGFLPQAPQPPQPGQAPPDTSSFLNSPGGAMAGAALTNLANTSVGRYGVSVDPIQAYQQAVQARAVMAQRQQAIDLQRQQAAADQEYKKGTMAVELAKLAQGPFKGTGMDAQSLNAMWEEAQRNGWSEDQFKTWASKAYLSKPRTITDAAGNVQTIPGMAVPDFNRPPDQQPTSTMPTAGAGVVLKPPSAGEADARSYYRNITTAYPQVLNLAEAGVEVPYAAAMEYVKSTEPTAFGLAKDYVMQSALSDDQKRYMDFIIDSGMIKLRDESGAAIADDELSRQMRQLLITSSDSPDRKKDKLTRMRNILENNFDKGGQWTPEQKAAHQDLLRQLDEQEARLYETWKQKTETPPEAQRPAGAAPGVDPATDPMNPANW